MSVTKTITTSKPFYVVAGTADLAVKAVREGTDRLASMRVERKDLEATFSTLQTETKALPAKAQTVAVTLAADVAGVVGTGYEELLGRGRSVVTRIRRQAATQDLKRTAGTTVRRTKALATVATKGAADTAASAKGTRTTAKRSAAKAAASTRTSAKGTATTARKSAASTRTATKSAATAARKTTKSAAAAVSDGAAKIGN